MKRKNLSMVTMILMGFILCIHHSANAVTAQELIGATGIADGLAIVVGTTDGALETELAKTSRFLVQGISTEKGSVDAARTAIRAAGEYGVASVDAAEFGYVKLPYATNLANVVVADLDALGSGAPAMSELLRITAPGGMVYARTGGSWSKTVKPRPASYDTWRQHYHDEAYQPKSNDKTVGLPTGVKWLAWYQDFYNNYHGLHGEHGQRLVVDEGTAVQVFLHTINKDSKNTGVYLDARDAFNGVPLWIKRLPGKRRSGLPHLVIDNNGLYTSLSPFWSTSGDKVTLGEPITRFNVRTAAPERALDKAGIPGELSDKQAFPLIAGDLFINAVRESLYVADKKTGAIKWTYAATGSSFNVHQPVSQWAAMRNRIVYPSVDTRNNRIYFGLTDMSQTPNMYNQRVQCARIKAVEALNLTTGQHLWRCDSFVGKGGGTLSYPSVGQLYPAGENNEYLVMFGPLMYTEPYLAAIDASTGKHLWQHDYQLIERTDYRDPKQSFNTTTYWNYSTWPSSQGTYWGTSSFYKDNRVWVFCSNMGMGFSPVTGAHEESLKPRTVNNRCMVSVAAADFYINGFAGYSDREAQQAEFTSISRGPCGGYLVPANGMIYTNSNGGCGCFVRLKQAVALSCDPLPADVDSAQRLVTGSAEAPADNTGNVYGVAPIPAITGNRTPVTTGQSAIRNDWNNNDYTVTNETTPVDAYGKKYVSIVNEHRVECRNTDGSVVWSFTTGGRVSNSPVLHKQMAFVGSHDGWVYCLRADNGELVWKFLAARAERNVVAHGQVESASPVFGVTMHEGYVCFSAGRHPELDGGIYVWGLVPATGRVAWHGIVRKEHTLKPITEKLGFANTTVNQVLGSSDGNVTLPGATIDPDAPPIADPVAAMKGYYTRYMGKPTIHVTRTGIAIRFARRYQEPVKISMNTMNGRMVLTQTVFDAAATFIPVQTDLGVGFYGLSIVTPDGKTFSSTVRVLK